jgi:hypothetical protein
MIGVPSGSALVGDADPKMVMPCSRDLLFHGSKRGHYDYN